MINDEINDQTFTLAGRIGEITIDELKKLMEKLIPQVEQAANDIVKGITDPELKTGKQTHKQLKRHNDGLTPLELTDPNLRFLNREMKRAKIDFAVEKDGKGKYVLYFKGKDADEMARAFKKYTQKLVTREKEKPSLTKDLAEAKEAAKVINIKLEKVKNISRGARAI